MPANNIDLNSLLETVNQAKSFLVGLEESQYIKVIKPHFSSSAGAHMRHIIDHYLALKDGLSENVVNYNKRNRHSSIESSPQTALQVWLDIENWLTEVSLQPADTPLSIICETSVNQTQNTHSKSTLARELVFVSSHAVHHFSLLAVISSLLGNELNAQFGIAPSTATYLRKQA